MLVLLSLNKKHFIFYLLIKVFIVINSSIEILVLSLYLKIDLKLHLSNYFNLH